MKKWHKIFIPLSLFVLLGGGCAATPVKENPSPAVSVSQPTPSTTPLDAAGIALRLSNPADYHAVAPRAFTLKSDDCLNQKSWDLFQKTFTQQIFSQELGGVTVSYAPNYFNYRNDDLSSLGCSITWPHVAYLAADKIFWVQDCGVNYTEPAAADYVAAEKTTAQAECARVGKLVSDYFSARLNAAATGTTTNPPVGVETWGTWIHPVYQFSMTLPLGVTVRTSGTDYIFYDLASQTDYATMIVEKDIPGVALPPEKIENFLVDGVPARIYHDTDLATGKIKLDRFLTTIPGTEQDLYLVVPVTALVNFDLPTVVKSIKWKK